MNKLKEIDGTMYQSAKVVILFTEKASNICIYNDSVDNFDNHKGNILQYFKNTQTKIPITLLPQHFYITSDEEIEVGDWYYNSTNNDFGSPHIEQCEYDHEAVACNNKKLPLCYKIIATTDPSLGLPLVSKQFIQKYVEEHNKGNIITNVLVEIGLNSIDEKTAVHCPTLELTNKVLKIAHDAGYKWHTGEKYYTSGIFYNKHHHYHHGTCYILSKGIYAYVKDPKIKKNYTIISAEEFLKTNTKIKTDSHGCITIRKVKDSWTREEVEVLLKQIVNFTIRDLMNPDKNRIDNWIKENL